MTTAETTTLDPCKTGNMKDQAQSSMSLATTAIPGSTLELLAASSDSDDNKQGAKGMAVVAEEESAEHVRTKQDHYRGFWEGAACACAVFLPIRFVDERLAEDMVDILHSFYAGAYSLRLSTGVVATGDERIVALPGKLKATAQMFFARSIGYFWADLVYVLGMLVQGHQPHLWQGRIGHHIIQSAANFPALFGSSKQTDAACTYLSIAYLAEISNIFLRINNVLKRSGSSKHALWKMNFRALLASFFLFRVVNFPFCIALIWRYRAWLPKRVRQGQLTFGAFGMALNVGWFTMLCQIFRAASRNGAPKTLL